MEYRNLFSLIDDKFNKCFKLLTEHYSVFVNTIEWQCLGRFDYDPINSDRFIKELCVLVGDVDLYLIYINIDLCNVQKEVQFSASDLWNVDNTVFKNLKHNHTLLHNCDVEGSYYLFGDSEEWVVFYDASTDIGTMVSQDKNLMISMSDYLIVDHLNK